MDLHSRANAREQRRIQVSEDGVGVGGISLDRGRVGALVGNNHRGKARRVANIPVLNGLPVTARGSRNEAGVGVAVCSTIPGKRSARFAVGSAGEVGVGLVGGNLRCAEGADGLPL
jgi:hypothetical protein